MTAEKLLELAREHARLYRYARVRALAARAEGHAATEIEYREALADGKWAQLMSLLTTAPHD